MHLVRRSLAEGESPPTDEEIFLKRICEDALVLSARQGLCLAADIDQPRLLASALSSSGGAERMSERRLT